MLARVLAHFGSHLSHRERYVRQSCRKHREPNM